MKYLKMIHTFLDKYLVKFAQAISEKVKPSTLLMCVLVAVILSLPLGWILGQWVVNCIMAGAIIFVVSQEYLYAKSVENQPQINVEVSAQSSLETEHDQQNVDPGA